jgi:hypothetical protein
MGDVVVVLPFDLRSDRNRCGTGIEGEIIDPDADFAGRGECAINDAAYRGACRECAEAVIV